MGTETPMSERVLLIETVTPGRFFAGWAFPFVKALLARSGASVRWLRFAVPADVQLAGDVAGVDLSDDDRAALVEILRAHGATHALFSARPAPALVATVVGARPGCRLGVMGQTGAAAGADRLPADRGPADLVPADLVPTGAAVLDWALPGAAAEAEAAPSELVSVEDPDYGFEAVGAAARAMTPFVFVCAGHACTYRAPLATSAFFAERTLPDLPERWGCAFCTVPLLDRPRHEDRGPAPPLNEDLLRRQLVAIARTHPPVSGALSVRVDGSGVVARPARFAALVEELALPPVRFLVDYRADALVRLRDELDEAARRLGARGHRLDVCLVGVESFSARQLDRYHKGYGPETNLRAVRVLRELEAAHPGAFAFREYGGLSTILFDPWVGLGDVSLNIAIARRFRIEKLCGKLLTSRLRLVEGLPLTRAARADGLLVDRYDDPLLDTARRNRYADELPWRFADARMDAVNRLVTRLPHDDALAGDRLHERLQPWVVAQGGDVLRCAERICREAAEAPSHLPPEALLARLTGPAARSGGDAADADSAAGGDAPDEGRFALGFDHLLDVAAFRAGLKPVLKLEEPYATVHLEAIERLLRERWPTLTLRRRQRQWGGAVVTEVFAGPDAAPVEEAVRLSDAVETEIDPARRRAAFTRIGVLLGYPECCAAAFAAEPPFFQENNEWLIVKRRLQALERSEGGAVDPIFHPVRTGYVPCALDCEATRAFVTKLEAAGAGAGAGAGAPPPPRAAWGDLPTALLLERPGDALMLAPLEDAGERFRYRVAAARTADPRRAAVEAGDTLSVEPGLLRVLRGGQETAWFALDAFLWQHDRVQHAAFWQECLREVEDPIDDAWVARAAREADDEAADDPRTSLRRAIRAATEELLRILEANPKQVLRGWRAASVDDRDEARGWGDLVVVLTKGDDRLRLFVEPREGAGHAFVALPHFAVTHDAATPIRGEERERVVVTLARALERYVAPRVWPEDPGQPGPRT